ncbi:hypothetical protein BKA70DRAFT_1427646 [Coprinopsis sp. MPI-PUGE-AT-0042]|nr:hypothetical protein BKA70DRAFT_1427646 [Coprinopsis sp. MPI-PUGE-AT-0042]
MKPAALNVDIFGNTFGFNHPNSTPEWAPLAALQMTPSPTPIASLRYEDVYNAQHRNRDIPHTFKAALITCASDLRLPGSVHNHFLCNHLRLVNLKTRPTTPLRTTGGSPRPPIHAHQNQDIQGVPHQDQQHRSMDLKVNAGYIRMADRYIGVLGGSNNCANVNLLVDVAERADVHAVCVVPRRTLECQRASNKAFRAFAGEIPGSPHLHHKARWLGSAI